MTVEIYKRPGRFCPSCFAVESWLTKLGVPFQILLLDDDITAEFKDKGFMEQPIVVAFGEAHSGFKPQRLQEIASRWREEQES